MKEREALPANDIDLLKRRFEFDSFCFQTFHKGTDVLASKGDTRNAQATTTALLPRIRTRIDSFGYAG